MKVKGKKYIIFLGIFLFLFCHTSVSARHVADSGTSGNVNDFRGTYNCDSEENQCISCNYHVGNVLSLTFYAKSLDTGGWTVVYEPQNPGSFHWDASIDNFAFYDAHLNQLTCPENIYYAYDSSSTTYHVATELPQDAHLCQGEPRSENLNEICYSALRLSTETSNHRRFPSQTTQACSSVPIFYMGVGTAEEVMEENRNGFSDDVEESLTYREGGIGSYTFRTVGNNGAMVFLQDLPFGYSQTTSATGYDENYVTIDMIKNCDPNIIMYCVDIPENHYCKLSSRDVLNDRIEVDESNNPTGNRDGHTTPNSTNRPTLVLGHLSCAALEAAGVIGFVKNLYFIGLVIIVLLFVFLTMGDYTKAVAASNDDEIKKANKHVVTRIIILAIYILAPALIAAIINIMPESYGLKSCLW